MCMCTRRYQEYVHEEMSCALSLDISAPMVFPGKSLNDYTSGKLDWSFSVGICRHGAGSMTGRISGLIARVQEVAPECESAHCVIHREMLANEKMLPELNSVFNNVFKVINHIEANALNSRCLAVEAKTNVYNNQ